MPAPDPPHTGKAKLGGVHRYLRMRRKPPRPRDGGGGAERVPVEPPRPRDLSGGAAAELDFEE
jgi:hypothetical protein